MNVSHHTNQVPTLISWRAVGDLVRLTSKVKPIAHTRAHTNAMLIMEKKKHMNLTKINNYGRR